MLPIILNGRKMKGASFEQKSFKTHSNIRLQVELTPWVGILWLVTPRHVAKVISGHGRSPAVFRAYIAFDRDQLERWKHIRCVQVDDTDRLICNMTFSVQVVTLTWGHLSRSNYISFGASRQEKYDARCKINVVFLLSQKLLQKKRLKRLFLKFLLSGGQTVDLRLNLSKC